MLTYEDVNLLLDIVGRMPGWLVFGYFYTKTLDLRDPKRFWFYWLPVPAVFNTLFVFWYTTISRALCDVLTLVAVPLLLSKGKIWYRVLVILAANAGVLASEMVFSVFSLLIGYDAQNFRDIQAHPFDYYATQCLLALAFAFALYLVYLLVARMKREQSEPILKYFGACLFGQVALVCAMFAVSLRIAWGDRFVLLFSIVFAVVCISVDALIIYLANQANVAHAHELRSEALRAQLDTVLEHYRGVANEVQAVARFRHDLRDQLQSVTALVQAGDYVRAEALVAQLEAFLANDMEGRR